MSAFLFSENMSLTSNAPVTLLGAGNYAISDIFFGISFVATSAAVTTTLEFQLEYTAVAEVFMTFTFASAFPAGDTFLNSAMQRVFPKDFIIPRGSQINLTVPNLVSPVSQIGIFVNISGYTLP
jgi:hypothetical protein